MELFNGSTTHSAQFDGALTFPNFNDAILQEVERVKAALSHRSRLAVPDKPIEGIELF